MAYYATRVFALCHLSGTNTLLHLHFAMFSESNSTQTQSNCAIFTSKFKKMNIRAFSLCVNKMPINLRYKNRYCSLALVSWIEMRSSVFNKASAIDVNRRYIITANYLATYKRKYLYYAILAIGIWLPIYNRHNHPLINDRIASFGPSKVESDINWRPVDKSRPIDFFLFFSLFFFFKRASARRIRRSVRGKLELSLVCQVG